MADLHADVEPPPEAHGAGAPRSGAIAVTRAVLVRPGLRSTLCAYAGFQAGEYAAWIAILVYAYSQGGTSTAAIVAVIQLVPAALCGPVAGALADRGSPGRVLFWGYLAQALGLGVAAAAIIANGPALAVYAAATVASTAVAAIRPAQSVLLPVIATTPDELTAANVAFGWADSATSLAGPIVTAAILVVAGPGTVCLIFAAVLAASALLVLPLAVRRRDGAASAGHDSVGAQAVADPTPEPIISSLAAGLATLRREPSPRLVVGALTLSFVAWGAFDVLALVLAIDVLGIGESGVGWLNAAFAAGGLVAGTAALALVGRRRLALVVAASAALLGASFAPAASTSSVAIAVVLLGLAGAGQRLLDVSARTLLQRIAPADVLARIFGVQEGLAMVGLAVGAAVVPGLVAAGGAELAFAVTGGACCAIVLLLLRRLLAIDRAAHVPIVELSLLRTLPIFAPLRGPALEGLAAGLTTLELAPGSIVIREGDPGDRFYAIADGRVAVTRDGALLARLERGDGFGEVALLHETPRNATVTAASPLRLYALDRDTFLTAVTGHAASTQAALALAAARRAPGLAEPQSSPSQ